MSGQYVRVYYTIRSDPRFEGVYSDATTLGTWLQLLMAADAAWPAPADLPKSAKAGPLRRLISAGIVEILPGHLYRIHGLDAERERRAGPRRSAAQVRWGATDANAMHMHSTRIGDQMQMQSTCNANALPARAEQEQEQEQESEQRADPVVAYYLLTTSTPRGRALEWVKRLGEQYGFEATSAAMGAAWQESDDIRSLLSRTQDRLVLDAREAELRERAQELAALAEKKSRRLVQVVTPPPTLSDAEIAALAEGFKATVREPSDAA